jgi:type IV pilus assembly protein PilW
VANTPDNALTNAASPITVAGSFVNGRVFNLGPRGQQVSHVYAVRNGNLAMCDLLTHDCTAVARLNDDTYWRRIASNVIRFSVELNAAGAWTQVAPATRAAWLGPPAAAGVTAVRLALVTWSDVFEKDAIDYSAGSIPTAAGLIPWAGGSFDVGGQIPNWNHYRYKLIETEVVLRNLIGGRNIPEGPAV